ncbi:MAG: UDP-glucose 4-epimerase GalE [Desulfobacterales bacterium]|nr:MAG: UDP-glucose 4-epimerase GalE [Desulfobacterales bacterium]
MLNVLVTGGAGYIGAHCCKELYLQGYHPITIDNLVYGHKESVKWGDFYQGDIGNPDHLRDCLKKYKIDAVMHFAAYAYVGESMEDPLKYYTNNVFNTINLLNLLLGHHIKYFVFSSSCATYGNPVSVPIYEGHQRKPISPYGRTKRMIEEILEDLDAAYGLKFISLRYFNAAGADPEGDIGEKHDPETHLIPLVLDVAAGKSNTIKVFGTDYQTEDGTCIRDYIHVTDLARAHILALEKLLDGSKSSVLNLGQGKGYSVLEVIQKAKEVTGKAINVVNSDRRPGDPPVLVASNQKAIQQLGWKPELSNLDDIIRTAWNWHRKI